MYVFANKRLLPTKRQGQTVRGTRRDPDNDNENNNVNENLHDTSVSIDTFGHR